MFKRIFIVLRVLTHADSLTMFSALTIHQITSSSPDPLVHLFAIIQFQLLCAQETLGVWLA